MSYIVLGAEVSHTLQVARIWDADASLSLDWFHHESRCVGVTDWFLNRDKWQVLFHLFLLWVMFSWQQFKTLDLHRIFFFAYKHRETIYLCSTFVCAVGWGVGGGGPPYACGTVFTTYLQRVQVIVRDNFKPWHIRTIIVVTRRVRGWRHCR